MTPEKYWCAFCHGMTYDEHRSGNCSACGTPRDSDAQWVSSTRLTPEQFPTTSWTLSDEATKALYGYVLTNNRK